MGRLQQKPPGGEGGTGITHWTPTKPAITNAASWQRLNLCSFGQKLRIGNHYFKIAKQRIFRGRASNFLDSGMFFSLPIISRVTTSSFTYSRDFLTPKQLDPETLIKTHNRIVLIFQARPWTRDWRVEFGYTSLKILNGYLKFARLGGGISNQQKTLNRFWTFFCWISGMKILRSFFEAPVTWWILLFL